MPHYSYTAWDPDGKPVTGVIVGDSDIQAAGLLRARGLVVSRLELNKDLDPVSAWQRYRGTRPIPLLDLAMFCRQFATMIEAGVPILQTLRVIAGQARGRHLGLALEAVAQDVEAGESLTEAFHQREGQFPELLVHMVAVGEAGGVLEEVMQRLADLYERENAINQKTRSAMIYPGVVLGASVLVAGFLVTFVLPRFATLFAQQGVALPWPTRFLLGLADFIIHDWYVLVLAVAALTLGFTYLLRRPEWALRRDRLLLRVPVLGRLRLERAMGQFARTLGTLLRTGVPVLPALTVAGRGLGNRALAAPLTEAQQAVRDGHSLLGPLRQSRLYPPMLMEMVAIGEETGGLDQMLFKAADYYDREVTTTVDRLTALIEPAMVLVLGATVGFIVLSLVLPMFDSWRLIAG